MPLPPTARLRGELHFRDVAFGYEAEKPILSDISFHCAPGQSVALIGSTGSGKTSLVNLLPRFYDYTAGSVTLDGRELPGYPRHWLRHRIGIVEQEPFLFSRTIRENITYGVPGEVSDAAVEEAARSAAIHDVILSFPKGYDTLVGEKGVTLSGGQKQRVAIARTILKNPAILILDDSTSSVDTETEALIRAALERLMQGRTSFVIAHRVQSLMKADLILVFDGGRIVERGTHATLAAKEGMYHRIFDLQTRDRERAREGREPCLSAFHDEEEFTTRFNGRTVLRMFGEMRRYWPRTLVFLVAIAAVAVADSYNTYLNKRIIDEAIGAHDPSRLGSIALLFGLIMLGQSVAVFGMIAVAGILGERIQYDLRKRCSTTSRASRSRTSTGRPSGWIMARVTSDSGRIAGLVTWGMLDVCWALSNIVSSTVFMFLINARLAGLIFAAIPFLVIVAVVFKNRIVGEFRKVRKLNSKITAAYNENITGARVVKALCREERNLGEFSRLDRRHARRGLPGRVAVRPVPADRADHHRGRHRGHRVERRACSRGRG